MPKLLRTCLVSSLLIFLAVLVCLGVWFAGTMLFGLPTARENLGPPAPDLNQIQEIALSIYLMLNQASLDEPAGDPRIVWTIEVTPGESAQTVIDQLRTIGILNKAVLFRSYIRYLGLDRGIEAGMYDLSGAMTLRELATALQSARLDTLVITVPEGWRVEEIAQLVDSVHPTITYASFTSALNSASEIADLTFEIPSDGRIEGFLFPDTYVLNQDMNAEDLIQLMISNFETRVDDEVRRGLSDQGLSLYEGVTLASIVEREAILPEERPRIAAVFLNRLAIGMNLDADPTVQYAIATLEGERWWPQLTLQDLQFDSPYNTYRYPGLPPGAIASPGIDSIKAVAFPLSSAEYYFRALCDGSGGHAFAETFEQHQANSCP